MSNEVDKGGRPEWCPSKPERAMVILAIKNGIPQDQIAGRLGVDTKTLRKHCRTELDTGAYEANMAVGDSIFQLATQSPDDNVRFRASAYWAARRMGWKETVTNEQVGKDGGAIEHTVTLTGILAKGDETI